MSNFGLLRSNVGTSGQIQVIFGPMFSGKTTELMRRMKRYQIANYNCLVVKFAADIRYHDSGIATHDRQVLPAVSCERLFDLQSVALKHEIIGIDEGQFFPDIVAFSEKMADQGKVVIVAALDGTYQKKGFGDILNLVPLAEHVMKLTAVCMNCYNEASFTKKKESVNPSGVIDIGGADKYLAVCRECFTSPSKSPMRSPLKAIQPSAQSESVKKVSKALFKVQEDVENMNIAHTACPTVAHS